MLMYGQLVMFWPLLTQLTHMVFLYRVRGGGGGGCLLIVWTAWAHIAVQGG
jgi:hypothetical protein